MKLRIIIGDALEWLSEKIINIGYDIESFGGRVRTGRIRGVCGICLKKVNKLFSGGMIFVCSDCKK